MPHVALQMAQEFHETMGQSIGDPRRPDITVDQALRIELIREEFEELKKALAAGDVIEAADALADLQYVINGAAVSWGIDLASVYEEVHASNMTKAVDALHETNSRKLLGLKRADGKVMKGPNYRPPDVARVLKDVAEACEAQGFGADGFWPEPTVDPTEIPHSLLESLLEDEDPPQVTLELKTAAAMKSIKEDFVTCCPVGELDGDDHKGDCIDPGEMDRDTFDEEPTHAGYASSIQGAWTSYGAYVFDCPCGRTHAVQGKLGSRGGLASETTAECMCGKAFAVEFHKGKNPTIHVTSIEELRKVQG